MNEPGFIIEEVSEPDEIMRCRAQDERHRRNSDWLQSHWADVLPQARGKFLAVAGQEPFIAGTAAEVWAWVESAHPEDNGAIVRCVRREAGPRIYADHRRVAVVRRRCDPTAATRQSVWG